MSPRLRGGNSLHIAALSGGRLKKFKYGFSFCSSSSPLEAMEKWNTKKWSKFKFRNVIEEAVKQSFTIIVATCTYTYNLILMVEDDRDIISFVHNSFSCASIMDLPESRIKLDVLPTLFFFFAPIISSIWGGGRSILNFSSCTLSIDKIFWRNLWGNTSRRRGSLLSGF